MSLYPAWHLYEGRRYSEELPPAPRILPADMRFVRVLHEVEVPAIRRNVPPRQPEVRALFPNHFVEFGKYWQELSWKLNPLLNAGNMTAVYDAHLWIANDQGFGMNGQNGRKLDPRANYFTNSDLSRPLPKVEALTVGGNVLHVLGEVVVMEVGRPVDHLVIEALDGQDPAPSPEWLQARPWLITEAVKLDGNGLPVRFPQGYSHLGYTPGVRHPFVMDPSRFRITIPKWRCVPWTEGEPPDPYKVYL